MQNRVLQDLAVSRSSRQAGRIAAKSAPPQDSRRYFAAEEADSSPGRRFWSLDSTSLVASGGSGAAEAKPTPLRLQPKLRIGAVDDPLEHEADRIADRVLRTPDATPQPVASLPAGGGFVQRKCSCGGKCESCKSEAADDEQGQVQMKPAAATVATARSVAPPIVHDVLRSPGRPLDAATRSFFEPRFQFDFSRVRVHADAPAAASARAVNARAYTVGSHIVLGGGEFASETADRRLLAHELAHVVQQDQGIPQLVHRSPGPMLMRSPLLSSTMNICKRVLKGEHTFHVSDGGVIVTTNASWEPSDDWEGSERPKCDIGQFHVTLTQKGRIWDSEYGDCTFNIGAPHSRQWINVPEDDYYLTIWTDNTYPYCCLKGSVEVSQQKGLTGDSCTQPPPGPLEMLHDALNVAGLIPALGAIPDAVNAGIYVIQGDWANAGISAVAMIPVLGDTANIVKIGERTTLKVGGEAVEKLGAEEIGAGFKEAKAAEAAKAAKEAEAAKAAAAVADEIKLSKEEYEAALKMVFPSQYVDPVAKLVDDIGQNAAKRAMENPKFVKAIEDGDWKLAGTYFHTAAKEEARAVPKAMLPHGWTLEAEKTLQSGAGGGRADLFLKGPGSDLVEFDWKTSGKSALSSSSRKEMLKHAGQVQVHMGSRLMTQESRSWMDYVRPYL